MNEQVGSHPSASPGYLGAPGEVQAGMPAGASAPAPTWWKRLRRRRAIRWAIVIADRSVIVVMTVLITLLAQLIVTVFNVPEYTLPSPYQVLLVFKDEHSALWQDTLTTLEEIAIGLSIGLALGLILGALIAESKIAQKLVAPYVVALVSTPLIVFAPLFAIWFGYGLQSKVVMIVLMTFAPLTVNAIQGFLSLDNDKYELMRSLSASRFEINIKARFPNALPYIFSGAKISAVLSVIAVVAAEFIGSTSGLGHTVYYAQTIARSDLLIAAALILCVIGLLLFYGVAAIQKRVVFWQ
jgi:NitT/TauT family transport system permease protein